MLARIAKPAVRTVLRATNSTFKTIYRTTGFSSIFIFALWLRWRCYLLLINIFANHAFHQTHHESYRIFTNLKVTEIGHIANTSGIVTFFHHPLLRPGAHFDDAFGATFSTVFVHMHHFEVLLRRLFRHLAPLPIIYRTNGFLTVLMV